MDIYNVEKLNGYEYAIEVIKNVIDYVDEHFDKDNDNAVEYEIDILNKAIEVIKLHKLEKE
jgi:hypothetical protein